MMPPLHSPIARSSGPASLRLDDARERCRPASEHEPAIGGRDRPAASRRPRPPPPARGAAPRAGARSSRCAAAACRRTAPDIVDVALRPRRPASAGRAARTASPVPRGGVLDRRSAPARRRAPPRPCSRPITTTVSAGSSGCSASSTCANHRPPGDLVQHLGVADFMRVPSPAARMMAANSALVIDGSMWT